VQQNESLLGMQEVDDAVSISAMSNSQFPELLFQMPGIRHTEIDSEFLEKVERSGNSGSGLGIE
jgi:hypothetical protein